MDRYVWAENGGIRAKVSQNRGIFDADFGCLFTQSVQGVIVSAPLGGNPASDIGIVDYSLRCAAAKPINARKQARTLPKT